MIKKILALLLLACAAHVSPAVAVTAQSNDVCTAFTATTASQQLLASRARTHLLIQNNGTVGVWVGTNIAQADLLSSIYIIPGGNYEPAFVPVNSIWVESASATAALVVCEGVQ